ncbi:hypothetical protein Tco_1273524 [Tanacetum coccineum]
MITSYPSRFLYAGILIPICLEESLESTQERIAGPNEGSGIILEVLDEPKDNSSSSSSSLSRSDNEIQSMVDVPIHQEDPAVQRTPLVDTAISMFTISFDENQENGVGQWLTSKWLDAVVLHVGILSLPEKESFTISHSMEEAPEMEKRWRRKVCSSLEGYSGLVLAWQGNCIWEALGGNTHDLDSIWEETRQDYNFTRSGFKDARTVPGDCVLIPSDAIRTYKRRRQDLCDGVRTPSHEGYRNTIELPDGNNVVPLRSDTIRLVQNGYSFHGLRSEDPNQHIKDFLKLVDSLDLDVANRERTRLRLF